MRDDILKAAGQLLEETGREEAVSIRAIADAVGVTPPSIYLHFPDKDALLLAVCQETWTDFSAVLARARGSSTDPVEQVKEMAREYVRFGLEHPEHYRLLFMTPEIPHPGEGIPKESGFYDVVAAVEDAIRLKKIRKVDPFLASVQLWAMVHGLTSLLITQPMTLPPAELLVDNACEVLLDGLRPRR